MSDTGMSRPLDRLLAIMARLRDPQRGCPWDLEQNFATIAPYTLEEAYEVADAITRSPNIAYLGHIYAWDHNAFNASARGVECQPR